MCLVGMVCDLNYYVYVLHLLMFDVMLRDFVCHHWHVLCIHPIAHDCMCTMCGGICRGDHGVCVVCAHDVSVQCVTYECIYHLCGVTNTCHTSS